MHPLFKVDMCMPVWYNVYVRFRKTRHSMYNIKCHFVWIPKDRRPVLAGPIRADLESLINEYAAKSEQLERYLPKPFNIILMSAKSNEGF